MTGTVIILNAGEATRLAGEAPHGIKSLALTENDPPRRVLDDQLVMFPGWDVYVAVSSTVPAELAGRLRAEYRVTPLSIPERYRTGSLPSLRSAVDMLPGRACPPYVCLYGDTITGDRFDVEPVAREWIGWAPAERSPVWPDRPWEVILPTNAGTVVEYGPAEHPKERVHVGMFGWWDRDLPLTAGDELLTVCARSKQIEVTGWWDVGDVESLDRYRRHRAGR